MSPRESRARPGSKTAGSSSDSSKPYARRTGTTSVARRRGYFGEYGGRFAPETLMAPLEELERAFDRFRRDRRFRRELDELLRTYAGRPTPLTFADRLSARIGGARIAL